MKKSILLLASLIHLSISAYSWELKTPKTEYNAQYYFGLVQGAIDRGYVPSLEAMDNLKNEMKTKNLKWSDLGVVDEKFEKTFESIYQEAVRYVFSQLNWQILEEMERHQKRKTFGIDYDLYDLLYILFEQSEKYNTNIDSYRGIDSIVKEQFNKYLPIICSTKENQHKKNCQSSLN